MCVPAKCEACYHSLRLERDTVQTTVSRAPTVAESCAALVTIYKRCRLLPVALAAARAVPNQKGAGGRFCLRNKKHWPGACETFDYSLRLCASSASARAC